VAFLLDDAVGGSGVVEVKVDFAVLGHAELVEEIVEDGRAIGIEDLPLDRTDPQVFQRGVVFAGHLCQAELKHLLQAFQLRFRTEGADVLDFIGKDRVFKRDMRHDKGTCFALVVEVLYGRCAARSGFDEVETAFAFFDHDRSGGNAGLGKDAKLADPARDEGDFVDRVRERNHGKSAIAENIKSGHMD